MERLEVAEGNARVRVCQGRPCELCGLEAVVLCSADQAYLCWNCDAAVHGANFLVARHTRSILCQICSGVTLGVATGDHPKHTNCLCPGCDPAEIAMAPGTPDADGEQLSQQQCLGQTRAASPASEQGETCGDTRCCEQSEREGGSRARKRKYRTQSKQKLRHGSPQSVLSCPRSPSIGTVEQAHVNEQPSALKVKGSQESLFAPEEASCSYPPVYGSAPPKRRRCHKPSVRRLLERVQEQGAFMEDGRIERVLIRWHWNLGFSSTRVITIALRIFRRAARALHLSQLTGDITRHMLAACLWLAAKLDDEQSVIPRATEMGNCTGVSSRRLVAAELQLLQLLDCRVLDGILSFC